MTSCPDRTRPSWPTWLPCWASPPRPGRAGESLWSRRALALTQPSLGSPVALRDLLELSVEGVADVSFITQADGSQKVYLVSSLAPPSGQNPGIPTAAQNAAALALVNNGRSRHIGRPFAVESPTATLYAVVLTVYYDASATPDLAALQARVAGALESFVVASRRLGVSIALSNLYDGRHGGGRLLRLRSHVHRRPVRGKSDGADPAGPD